MWLELPEKHLMLALGDSITKHRKNRKLTQPELAKKAGIGVATLVRLENTGQANLSNCLRVFRALRLLDRLEDAMQLPSKSPMQQFEAQKKA
jgi:transcriptional regulator with XRE-family HTH domain